MNLVERTSQAIREVPDFPKEGILFKDITPIMEDPALSRDIVEYFRKEFEGKGIDAIVGIESRGFLFGMAMSMAMDIPFITVRKKGKLPSGTVSYKYDLEYGSAEIEMHDDSMGPGWNVLIHDDLLATGGTAAAAAELIKKQGGNVGGFAFLVELSYLKGMEKIQEHSENIVKLVSY